MSWTDERVELLTKLWSEGKTAAEIAKELGGVTRNAVIGKAHRLKLSNRVSPIQQNKKPAPVKVQAAPPAPERKIQKAPVLQGQRKKNPSHRFKSPSMPLANRRSSRREFRVLWIGLSPWAAVLCRACNGCLPGCDP